MFDKLIESNSVQADFKPRRKFFMVSSVIVGIAFISAVVLSLYAQDIDLGNDKFELAELIAPVAPNAPEPDPPREQPQQRTETPEVSELPNRRELIANINQTPEVPEAISTTPLTALTIPDAGRFTNLNKPDSNGTAQIGPVNNVASPGAATTVEPPPAEVVKAVDPPPPPVEKKRVMTVSKGVVNGSATSLPKPPFPPVAKAMGISGEVQVQILIDERGNVVSATAINGHLVFRPEAERAARRAKFDPTTLSGEPVKVTGVIVYRFSKQ